ncbi:hypothetical protein NMX13_03360 [Dickeya zeae]|nr:hypothetical protein NMX13_03360 [Dickeya zeae]
MKFIDLFFKKKIKDKRKKIHVVFIINDAYANNMSSLYFELSKSEEFKVLVVACDRVGYDFSPSNSAEDVSSVLKNENIEHVIDLTFDELVAFNPHFIFTSNPYDMYIKKEFHSACLCRIAKLVHISYGASLIEWEGDYAFLKKNPYIKNAYRIFTESRYLFRNDKRFHPVGYLKLDDYLYNNRNVSKFYKKSIAWKPRWTGRTDSSISTYIDFFIKLASCYDIIVNFIIHPMLFHSLIKSRHHSCTIDKINLFKCMENVNFVIGSDFLDDVLGSDIYIGDVSSTLAEFLSTGKPIIYTDTGNTLNELGMNIINSCYVVNNEGELESVCLKVLSGDDPKSEIRRSLFFRIFEYQEHVPVSERIKKILLSSY